MTGWLPRLWRQPSAVLLAVQLIGVLVYPSVGLSDIVPVLPHARSWVMIEQVAGLMYVALVISRIVGLTIARQRA